MSDPTSSNKAVIQVRKNDFLFDTFFCFSLTFFILQTTINPFHGQMMLPKPYGKERKVLVFAKVTVS